MIPGVGREAGSGILEISGEAEVLGERWGEDIWLCSGVLDEPGGVVETEHVASW